MCIFVPKDEIPGGTFMKKFCIAALAATLALGTMITAQAADTIDGTVVSGTYKRSTNGGRRRGLKSPAGGAWAPDRNLFHNAAALPHRKPLQARRDFYRYSFL